MKLCSWLILVSNAGIELNDAVREAYTVLRAKVALADYKTLLKLAEEQGVSIEELGRNGLPVKLKGLLKRQGLLVGLALCTAVLCYAGRYVWFISVNVDSPILQESIETFLAENGVTPGVVRHTVDTDELERQALLRFHDLAFFDVEFRGVTLTARGVLKIPEGAQNDPTIPTAVIASKGGIIEKITVLQGQAEVTAAQVVQPGELLISAQMPMSDGTFRLVHARGEVWARISYTGYASTPVQGIRLNPTGRKQSTSHLEFAGRTYGRPAAGCSYTLYKLTQYAIPLGLPNGIRAIRSVYEEYSTETISLPLQELMEQIGQEALEHALGQVPADAVPAEQAIVYYMDANNRLWAQARVDMLENIAREARVQAEETIPSEEQGLCRHTKRQDMWISLPWRSSALSMEDLTRIHRPLNRNWT